MADKNTVETYKVRGVAVTRHTPNEGHNKPPILMVHGGDHGAWCWEKWATFFCDQGYEVHALDWLNHGNSDALPESEFAHRSITEVARHEITLVAEQLKQPFILMGHSMGGLASAVYAAEQPDALTRLVLVAPVMPAVVHPDKIPLPVDPTRPFPVFPHEQTKQLFFTTMDDATALEYEKLLVPESSQAVIEATQWTVEIDLAKIATPALVLGVEFDQLIPKIALQRYATLLNAPYVEIAGIGHSDVLLKEPEWRDAAQKVANWIAP